jgi:CheY-like chemotaxis protein/MinD-like ATPase involved in chromosome partitioning or flagellar assembly
MTEKILIVDDDVDSLKLIGLMLQRQGYEVAAASTGTQALNKANAELPDLIILDVMMPDMSGYEVCKRLRSTQETKAIPIIMFTAKTLIDDKVAGFEAGADDYLTKPTHPSELASRVKSILARRVGNAPAAAPAQTGGNARPAPRGVAIGILGAKGGVGTSTIALNVAAALVQTGRDNPIVADFRLGMGSLGLFLGLGRSSGMANVLGRPVNEIRPQLIEAQIATHQSGLRALLCSARPREGLMNIAPDSAGAVVNALRTMARTSIYDLGSGLNPLNARAAREMDKIVVVVDATGVCLNMARELLREMVESVNIPQNKFNLIVLNRTQSSLQTPWQEVEQLLGVEIRAIISAAPELAFQATEAGTPIVMLQPNAIVANQLIKVSEVLTARIRTLAE